MPEGTKCLILAPVELKNRSAEDVIKLLAQQGYARIRYNGAIERIQGFDKKINGHFELVVDRVVMQHDESFLHRLADSVETAFFEGKGTLSLGFCGAPRRPKCLETPIHLPLHQHSVGPILQDHLRRAIAQN